MLKCIFMHIGRGVAESRNLISTTQEGCCHSGIDIKLMLDLLCIGVLSVCVLSRVCDRCAHVWATQNFSFEANFCRSGAVYMEFVLAGRNTRTANQLTDGRTQRAETANHIPEATRPNQGLFTRE